MKQIFVSYSTQDSVLAHKFRALFERNGYSVWIDSVNLSGGEEWAQVIPQEINKSVAVVVLLTENYEVSSWVPKEILKSLELKIKIIPLKFPGVEIPFILTGVVPVEFPENQKSRAWFDSCARLMGVLSMLAPNLPDVSPIPPAPVGWAYIDSLFFDSLKDDLQEDFVDYFDGREPNWKDAITDKVPMCSKAQSLVKWFENSRVSVDNKPTQKGIMLVGPGGEGKSTTIMQVLSGLIRHGELTWRVLWRVDNTRSFPVEYIKKLPRIYGTAWMVAADSSERIVKDVYEFIAKNDRDDVQYFLAARDTDLIKNRVGELNWDEVSVSREEIGKVDIEDAEKIVSAWPDRKKLPSISELSIVDAAKKFLTIAISDPTEQSSLYGALLNLRTGEGYRGRIERIFNTFKGQGVAGANFTLLDAYICIAVCQADNIQTRLPKDVLSEYLGVSPRELKIKVIEPLAKEIHLHSGFVYCRHRSVADAVSNILSESNELDKAQFYKDLLVAAFSIYREDVGSLDVWKSLWKDFASSDVDLAIELSKFSCVKFSGDAYLYVKVSRFLRDCGLPQDSIDLLARIWGALPKDRAVWSEWGCCEATSPLSNHAKGAWLQGVSLSDYVEEDIKPNRIAISLVQLIINFWELWLSGENLIFLHGCYAANTLLGLLLAKNKYAIDIKGHEIFNRKKIQLEEEGARIGSVFPETHVSQIQLAVIEAWNMIDENQRVIKTMPALTGSLNFDKLSLKFPGVGKGKF
ncbi:MAG: TIR domain-containing protein [Anaerolineales bacterium]|nr:TIR domain-containing protein [Anaerolineales bacterium]